LEEMYQYAPYIDQYRITRAKELEKNYQLEEAFCCYEQTFGY
jgi:hypothetical protein